MGLMTMLGNFVGGGLLGFLLMQVGGMRGAYLILAAIMVIGMLGTVLLVDEPKRAESVAPPPFDLGAFLRGLLEPFAAWDFRWVFLTRFLVMLGIFTVQGFVLLYLRDMVGQRDLKFVFDFFGLASVTDVGQATSFFLTALLIGALVSSLYAGAISDRYGRKPIVYLSGALQGIVALTFLFAAHFPVVVLLGLVFGLGYGAYQAVDWALVTDVLPSADDHAKDMGLWHIALTLPQVIALPIAGILLDTFNRVGTPGAPNLGYYVIFSLAFVYFMLGTVLVSKIKGAK
jgi:MFS family permease